MGPSARFGIIIRHLTLPRRTDIQMKTFTETAGRRQLRRQRLRLDAAEVQRAAILNVDSKAISEDDWRSTGIVCTLGPAVEKVEMLEALLKAGMDVARFNFSHGTHPYHKKMMDNVRKAASNLNRMVTIALDTKG